MKNHISLNLLLPFVLLFQVTCLSQPPAAGLALWLRTDVGVFNDGSGTPATINELVQVWADQSGNGNDFIQTDQAKRPLLKYNVLCGQHVLRFDVGRSTYLHSLMRMNGPKTIFIVFIVPPFTNAAQTLISLKGNTDEFTEIVATDFATYGPITFIADLPSAAGGGAMQNSSGINASFSAEGNLLSMVYDGGPITNPSSYSANYDNVMVPTMSGGLLGRYSNDLSTIGARAPIQNINYLMGDIGEIIVYNRVLSATEINDVSNYLIFKFGLFDNCILLSLKLAYFNVKALEKRVNIVWKAADEGNILQYEVQRSFDGRSWNSIDIIPVSAATGDLQKNYSVFDNNPSQGWNYYRIASLNNRGIADNSIIKKIYYDLLASKRARLNPNPASRFFYIQTLKPETLSVKVFDNLGRTIKKATVFPSQEINVEGLPSGIYHVHAKGNNTDVTLKLVKQ